MPDEIDVWRLARLIITAEGDGAEAKARRSLEHCQRSGMTDGAAFWRRVEAAIREWRRTKREGCIDLVAQGRFGRGAEMERSVRGDR